MVSIRRSYGPVSDASETGTVQSQCRICSKAGTLSASRHQGGNTNPASFRCRVTIAARPEPALDWGRRSNGPRGFIMNADARPPLREQALVLEVIVQMCDELPVAVPDQRRPALISAKHMLRRLAPAPMWDVGIDVRPEAI